MYCIAILTDQEQEGQNCAEYIRNYCTEKKVFPLIEIYQNQEQFFGRIRKTVPAVVFLASLLPIIWRRFVASLSSVCMERRRGVFLSRASPL